MCQENDPLTKQDLREVEGKFTEKIDAISQRLTDIERRLTAKIEATGSKIDINALKIDVNASKIELNAIKIDAGERRLTAEIEGILRSETHQKGSTSEELDALFRPSIEGMRAQSGVDDGPDPIARRLKEQHRKLNDIFAKMDYERAEELNQQQERGNGT